MADIVILLACIAVLCSGLGVCGFISDLITLAIERRCEHDGQIHQRAR